MADYLVQETDGTSRFTLEDGSGSILLETSSGPTPTVTVTGGSRILVPRRQLVVRDEADEAALVLLVAATRRRYRPL